MESGKMKFQEKIQFKMEFDKYGPEAKGRPKLSE
jgi:hypothetical protein